MKKNIHPRRSWHHAKRLSWGNTKSSFILTWFGVRTGHGCYGIEIGWGCCEALVRKGLHGQATEDHKLRSRLAVRTLDSKDNLRLIRKFRNKERKKLETYATATTDNAPPPSSSLAHLAVKLRSSPDYNFNLVFERIGAHRIEASRNSKGYVLLGISAQGNRGLGEQWPLFDDWARRGRCVHP